MAELADEGSDAEFDLEELADEFQARLVDEDIAKAVRSQVAFDEASRVNLKEALLPKILEKFHTLEEFDAQVKPFLALLKTCYGRWRIGGLHGNARQLRDLSIEQKNRRKLDIKAIDGRAYRLIVTIRKAYNSNRNKVCNCT